MAEDGELNVGQLVREHFGNEAVLVGFTTHEGSVTAASDWGGVVERKTVRPVLRGSYEELFHDVGLPRFWINLSAGRTDSSRGEASAARRSTSCARRDSNAQSAPETERVSHYFQARLPDQFDAIIHIDETHAVEPLERTSVWDEAELPETYSFKV